MASVTVKNQQILKSFEVTDLTIASKACGLVTIDTITGYIPIACVYNSTDSGTTISPLSPLKRTGNPANIIQMYNSYTTSLTTSGTLYVLYMKN